MLSQNPDIGWTLSLSKCLFGW